MDLWWEGNCKAGRVQISMYTTHSIIWISGLEVVYTINQCR